MRFSAIFLGILSPVVLAPAFANSFTDDSQVTLTARNFYFDRDYKRGDDFQQHVTGHRVLS